MSTIYWTDSKNRLFKHRPFRKQYQRRCFISGEKVNEEREIAGIREALEYFKLKSGTILTKHKNDTIRENGLTIKLIPVWEWLLGGVE